MVAGRSASGSIPTWESSISRRGLALAKTRVGRRAAPPFFPAFVRASSRRRVSRRGLSVRLSAVKKVVSDLRAVHCPPSGSCSHHAYISIKPGVQGEAKRAAFAALAAVHYFKLVVVVDDDIDIYNPVSWEWRECNHGDQVFSQESHGPSSGVQEFL